MILLIRHAAAQGGKGRYIGCTDLPLSAEGRAQAEALAAGFAQGIPQDPENGRTLDRTLDQAMPLTLAPATDTTHAPTARPLAALYTSPLERARSTAAPLAAALGLAPIVLDTLREIQLGQWEGLDMDAVRRARPQEFAARGRDFAGFRPPGGESFTDLALRARAALRTMNAGPQPCAAVTHAGIIRVLLCAALELPLNNVFEFHPAHARCTLFKQPEAEHASEERDSLILIATDLDPAAAARLLLHID